MKLRHACALTTAAALVLVGCKKKEEPKPVAPAPAVAPSNVAPSPASPAPAAPAAQAPAAVAPSGAAGVAYFAVDKLGLVKLEGGKFTRLFEQPNNILQMVHAPNGTLYLYAIGGVYKVTGGKAQKIGDYQTPGSLDRLALAADGTLWGSSFTGISRYDGKAWTTEPKANLGADVKLLRDIAVDGKGRVFVVSSNAVHMKEGGAWKTLEVKVPGLRSPVFFERIAVAPSGTVYFGHSTGALAWDGTTFTSVKLGSSFFSIRHMAVGPNEQLHIVGSDSLVLVPKGGQAQTHKLPHKAWSHALAVDTTGQSWITTDNGVYILDATGSPIHWAQGSIPELASIVKALIVTGAGPALPTVGPVQTGGITGKLLKGGEAQANIEVEVCASPSSYFRKTPCNDAPWKQKVTTGADGVFTFKGVPLGAYRFAIKAGPKWSIGMSACCSGMKAGKVFDVGSITLK